MTHTVSYYEEGQDPNKGTLLSTPYIYYMYARHLLPYSFDKVKEESNSLISSKMNLSSRTIKVIETQKPQ